MTKSQTFWASVFHAVAQGVVWLAPLAVLGLGQYADMTVSAVLSAVVFWLHSKYLNS